MIRHSIALSCDYHPKNRDGGRDAFSGDSKSEAIRLAKLNGWTFHFFRKVRCPACNDFPRAYLADPRQ